MTAACATAGGEARGLTGIMRALAGDPGPEGAVAGLQPRALARWQERNDPARRR